MGAKAWFVAYYNHDPKKTLGMMPKLDREASASLVKKLLPGMKLTAKDDGSLDLLAPKKREVYVGVYGDLKIIAHERFGGDFPSRIDGNWHGPKFAETTYVHATYSVVDWCAFALWNKGELVRSVSVSPDSGVQENIGATLHFEKPFWDGNFALDDGQDYPLPFNPLELSEASLLTMLGFQFEGNPNDWVCDPSSIPIMRFQISKAAWWRFW